MRIYAGLMALMLVGCTQPPPQVAPVNVYRDTAAQIASQTDVTPERMAGDWVIRQRFPDGPTLSAVRFKLGENGALLLSQVGQFCSDDGETCGELEDLTVMVPKGPGRWQTQNPTGTLPDQELWVMWMDFDTRTAAIGTPSGEFGWIMDKNPTGGGDRIAAARDIMDWFGYDIEKLSEVER